MRGLIEAGVRSAEVEEAALRGMDPDDRTVAELSIMIYFTSEFEQEWIDRGESGVQEPVRNKNSLSLIAMYMSKDLYKVERELADLNSRESSLGKLEYPGTPVGN